MNLRNVAIIAHVDHGKTTLVDQLFRQSGTFRENQRVEERAIDSNDHEKERGITILAKCTSVEWEHDGATTHINIVDTPGHADFGAEVERILPMVDGVILLVDAAEGRCRRPSSSPARRSPGPEADRRGQQDRPPRRPPRRGPRRDFRTVPQPRREDEQLDFPTLYASGRAGYAGTTDDVRSGDLTPLFETIVSHVPPPRVDAGPFRMLATLLDRDPFLGRILTGRIDSGRLTMNMPIKAIDVNGNPVEEGRATKIFASAGSSASPSRAPKRARSSPSPGSSRRPFPTPSPTRRSALRSCAREIDPPTLAMSFSVNDSPYAGRDGDKVQSRVIRERLEREAEGNVAIRVITGADNDSFEVAGRGELQLGVLIETLRREGFELSISRPRVLFRDGAASSSGGREEPYETVVIDVDDEYSGTVIDKMALRKAEMTDIAPRAAARPG